MTQTSASLSPTTPQPPNPTQAPPDGQASVRASPTIGSREWPLDSREPIKLAKAVLAMGVSDPTLPWVVKSGGSPWMWMPNPGRWVETDEDGLAARCGVLLEDAYVMVGEDTKERLGPTRAALKEIAYFINTYAPVVASHGTDLRTGQVSTPAFTFEDVVVSVATGETTPRGQWWFDGAVLPCRWDPTATCPRYERTVAEWSVGEEGWVELYERGMAYIVGGNRKFAKFMLWYGQARGGKGTSARMLKKFLGAPFYVGMEAKLLKSDFAMEGTQFARVLMLNEVTSLVGHVGEGVGTIIRVSVGDDDTSINRKNMKILRGVTFPFVPVLVGHEMPVMGDAAGGLSSKMIPLAFRGSWVGRENYDLDQQLWEERAGILRRWFEAAQRLERSPHREKWPLTESGVELLSEYRRNNSVVDAFLDDCFVRDPHGQLDYMVVDAIRDRWEREKGVRIRNAQGIVPRNWFPKFLEDKSSWGLRRVRDGRGGRRMLQGLAVRLEGDDSGRGAAQGVPDASPHDPTPSDLDGLEP